MDVFVSFKYKHFQFLRGEGHLKRLFKSEKIINVNLFLAKLDGELEAVEVHALPVLEGGPRRVVV